MDKIKDNLDEIHIPISNINYRFSQLEGQRSLDVEKFSALVRRVIKLEEQVREILDYLDAKK